MAMKCELTLREMLACWVLVWRSRRDPHHPPPKIRRAGRRLRKRLCLRGAPELPGWYRSAGGMAWPPRRRYGEGTCHNLAAVLAPLPAPVARPLLVDLAAPPRPPPPPAAAPVTAAGPALEPEPGDPEGEAGIEDRVCENTSRRRHCVEILLLQSHRGRKASQSRRQSNKPLGHNSGT